ncbi:methyl-accepting chemotaxis protein [Pararobbsia alpina]|uniref:methyl-accepting chemotaxis protein n=1 Tax=Pararobbsia alpina TaxID=621374 RepID=UPI0039A6F199
MALVLVAIPSTFYFYGTNAQISLKEREISGIPTERAVLRALQLTQKHRADSAIWLSPDNTGDHSPQKTADDAETAYKTVSAEVEQFDKSDPVIQQWARTVDAWHTLRQNVANKSINQRESFTAHASVIANLLKANALLLDHYGLSIDGDLDTSHLTTSSLSDLPALTEELGKARAKGANILSQGHATPADVVELTNLLDRGKERSGLFNSAMGKATSQNPELAKLLTRPIEDAEAAAAGVLDLADKRIVNATALDLAPVEYVKQYTHAIDLFFSAGTIAVDGLDVQLRQQRSHLRAMQLTVLATLLVVVLLSAAFAMAVIRSVVRPIDQAVEFARRVAKGDLTGHLAVTGNNESAQLLLALQDMNAQLLGLVGNVRHSCLAIAEAANEIARGNTDLSQRTEEQAASLEETASTMEQLTASAKQNAQNAGAAFDLAHAASETSRVGGSAVESVAVVMDRISGRATKISEIVGLIDGIAFQTNILALNAAVEAARAGDEGRGFAVVAGEVRALAQRSASAAKEIKSLIEESVSEIKEGADTTTTARDTVSRTVDAIRQVNAIMDEIATASQAQGNGIDHVSIAISQMDQVTQQNAALVEQASASSAAMAEQAEKLTRAVEVFVVA